MKDVRPIFVLGSPRSGTTLIGNFIGSSDEVCDLGEYLGNFFSYYVAPNDFVRIEIPFKTKYLDDLKEHADAFATRMARENQCKYYCDSNQWNMLAIEAIQKQNPEAIFVFILRHYAGVLQSLERSARDGYDWAGKTLEDRAKLWDQIYSKVTTFPRERTIFVSYDNLCASPESELNKLKLSLASFGLDASKFDEKCLAKSHATHRKDARKCIAALDERGVLQYHPIDSFDEKKWSSLMTKAVYGILGKTDQLLQKEYRAAYTVPEKFKAFEICSKEIQYQKC